jgi:hypothetical protein
MRRFGFGILTLAGAVALASSGLRAQVAPVATPAASPAAAPATALAPATTPKPAVKPAPKPAAKSADKPLWNQLTPIQKTALEPLHGEWDPMEGVRKQKWLEFTKSFATMTPDEQQRVHERMREWVKLTPEQRKVARQNFIQSKTIAPNEKSATWETYKQLPDAQKQKLAEQATHKPLANVPPPKTAQHAPATALHDTLACPAGSIRNTAAATPSCVPAPVPGMVTSAAPAK